MTHKVYACPLTSKDKIISEILKDKGEDPELDLSSACFGTRSIEEFEAIMISILNHTTTLNLAGNGLYTKLKMQETESGASVYPLSEFLASIPPFINHLSLASNGLGSRPSELARALGKLSNTLLTVDLSDNRLDKMPKAGFQSVLSAIPKSVTQVDLSGHAFSKNQLSWLIEKWLEPSNIQILQIDSKHLSSSMKDRIKKILANNRAKATGCSLSVSSSHSFTFFTPESNPKDTDLDPLSACRSVDPEEWEKFINDNPSPPV